jgi:hypothetical protein
MIKSGRMRWTEHIASLGEIRNTYKILVGSLKERDHSEDLEIDGIVLKYILRKWAGKVWIGFIQFKIRTAGGFL